MDDATGSSPWHYDDHPPMFGNHPVIFSLLVLSIAGLLVIAVWSVFARSTRVAVSNSEILYEKGLLSKQRVQVNLESVRSVRVTQSMMQRMFNVGDVEIFTAGDYAEIAVRGLPRPNELRDIVTSQPGPRFTPPR